jgi:hypothetical protein
MKTFQTRNARPCDVHGLKVSATYYPAFRRFKHTGVIIKDTLLSTYIFLVIARSEATKQSIFAAIMDRRLRRFAPLAKTKMPYA